MKRPWPVLFLCCILAFNASGLAFGLGTIFTDIMDTFRASRASAALVQSLCGGIGFGAGVYLPFYLLSYTFINFPPSPTSLFYFLISTLLWSFSKFKCQSCAPCGLFVMPPRYMQGYVLHPYAFWQVPFHNMGKQENSSVSSYVS